MFAVDSAAAASLFWVSLALWLVTETYIFMRGRQVQEPGENRDDGTVLPLLLAGFGSIPLAFLIAWPLSGLDLPGGWPLMGLGLLVMWAGVGVRVWSVRTLGSFFQPTVTIQHDHRLVTSGPYRLIRHPSYTGALTTLLGIGLSIGNLTALLTVTVLPVLGYLPRIRAEEKALSEGFGREFTAYTHRTARLLPGIW